MVDASHELAELPPPRADGACPEPRLWLDRDGWERLGERRADPFLAAIAGRNAEGIAVYERRLDDLDAGRREPGVLRERVLKALLQRHVAAWYLDRVERHLVAARALIGRLLDRRAWRPVIAGDSLVHYGLEQCDLAYSASFALDALGPYLGAATRAALVDVLAECACAAYERGLLAREWWHHADFNWGASIHATAGLAALAIGAYDPAPWRRIAPLVREGLAFYFEAFPADGGWTEGMMYHATALGYLSNLVVPLHRLTGDDLGRAGDRSFVDALDWRLRMIGGDGRVLNLSDASDVAPQQFWLPQVYWWARRCGRPEWTWFEDRHVKPVESLGLFHDVEALWHRDPHQAARPPTSAPLVRVRGLDWATWRGERTWLAFRGGDNGGNNDNFDLGHFILGAGPDRFTVDPGWGVHATARHNAVTLMGQDQISHAVAPIFRLRELPRGFYLACDLTAAYPHRLAYHYRHLLLIDDAALLVVDDIVGRRGRRPMARFHLQARLPIETHDRGATIVGSAGRLIVSPLTPIWPMRLDAWEHDGIPGSTLSWSSAPDLPRTRHAMLLSIGPEATAFALVDDASLLDIGGRRHRIDLVEGWHEIVEGAT